MRVLLLTLGSRGDVQPFVALAKSLRASGHEVFIGAPGSGKEVAQTHGVDLDAELDDTFRIEMHKRTLSPTTVQQQSKISALRQKRLRIVNRQTSVVEGLTRFANFNVDLVVHHPAVPGQHLAEYFGVPSVLTSLNEVFVPTRSFPCAHSPVSVPKQLNRASYYMADLPSRMITFGNSPVKRWRKRTLRLANNRHSRTPLKQSHGASSVVLQAFSRHILPTPHAYTGPVYVTGYWFLEAPKHWSPPADLVHFLNNGEPPIYIGFGSIIGRDPHDLTKIVSEAVRRSGRRAVVAGCWGGIQPGINESRIFYIDDIPHDWLFSRVTAVVHHGGTGTGAAAFAAGRPQVLCPWEKYLRFHAENIYSTGVAPKPVPIEDLTPNILADLIRSAVTDERLVKNSETLRQKVLCEGGVECAVRVLEATYQASIS